MKKLFAYTSTLLLAFVLAGCNLTNVFPTVDLNVEIVGDSGSELVITSNFTKFERDQPYELVSTTIPSIQLEASAKAGSIGAYIETYAIDYFLVDGTQVTTPTGDSKRGRVGLRVRGGFNCTVTPEEECTVNSTRVEGGATLSDAYPAPSEPVLSRPFAPIEGEVADLFRDTLDSYASIVLEGTDVNGNSFSKFISPVTIIFRSEYTEDFSEDTNPNP